MERFVLDLNSKQPREAGNFRGLTDCLGVDMKTLANHPQSAESIALFWDSVEKTDGCWWWKLYINRGGYGHLNRQGKIYRAHRFAYEISKGLLADGMDVDHLCHNRACVNPDHLRATTRKQNLENLGARRGNTGVRGVHYIKDRGKYLASLRHHGKSIHCGIYWTLQEAEAAVIAKRNELFTHNDADRKAA